MIPKQDQPTTSEPDIDLEALMELSAEEQKTQLEVHWEAGPQALGLRLEAGLGLRGTQELGLCLPGWSGENQI